MPKEELKSGDQNNDCFQRSASGKSILDTHICDTLILLFCGYIPQVMEQIKIKSLFNTSD